MIKTVLCYFFGIVFSVQAATLPQITTHSFDFAKVLSFNSQILNQERKLNVYLPQSYDDSKTYPVIYLLDGSKDEDFIHIAGLVQFASFSWINMLPQTIVVGIGNVDRKHDFTPSSNNPLDQKELPTHGGAQKFIRFLQEEVKPLVEKNFRVNQVSTLIGQSLGGLLATKILFEHSQMFSHYIIVSPSLWWDDGKLLQIDPKISHSPAMVYVGVGKEGDVMEGIAKSLFQKLENARLPETHLAFGYFPELSHGDSLHLAVYDAFKQYNHAKKYVN